MRASGVGHQPHAPQHAKWDAAHNRIINDFRSRPDRQPMNLEEEQVCFYGEIGLAITNWAHVEDRLRRLVMSCVIEPGRSAIAVGFVSIENFRSKLDFTDKVVRRSYHGKLNEEEWAKLVDRARRASFRRNKLAHRRIRRIEKAEVGRRYALEPWISTKDEWKRAGDDKPLPGALCLRDIVAIRFEFVALTYALENFCSRLEGRKEPHPKSAEQPQYPPTIRQIKHRVLGEDVHLLPHAERKSKKKGDDEKTV